MNLKLNKLLKWKYFDYLFLAILFITGFLLRSYLIDKNLFFGPEQGRDMLVVKDIVTSHKLVLIGPKTAVEGIFHGPLYYYLAGIPFILSKGNPLVIELFFIFLNSLSVFLIYLLGKELFNRKISLIAPLLFTFSFGAIVMARWLSHPPLIIPVSCLFFLFLIRFIKGKNNYLIPTAIAYGVASQTEFSNLIIFTFVLFFTIIVFRKRFIEQKVINLIISLFLVVTLPTFNFILFDIRHDFLITKSIFKSQAHRPEFLSYIFLTLSGSVTQFLKVLSDIVSPLNIWGAAVIFVFCLYSLNKLRTKYKNGAYVLLIWIFSPFAAFILLRYNPLYHYFTSSIAAIIILFAVLYEYIFSIKKGVFYIAIALYIIMNFIFIFNFLPENKNVFFQSTQPQLKYSDQVSVIREIYKEANGQPFFYQAYTIPYWMQDGWQYLFWYYGNNDYNYIPKHLDKGLLFVIIQDDPSTKLYQHNWLKDTVSAWGVREGAFGYGALRVEKLIVK